VPNTRAGRVAVLLHEIAAPSKVLAALNTGDRKYHSPDCEKARKPAEAYQDTTAPRVALAVGASVALALVGAPVVVIPNAGYERAIRNRLNRALVSQCASDAQQIIAIANTLRQQAEVIAQNQETEQVW